MGEFHEDVYGNRYWWPDADAKFAPFDTEPLGPEWQNLGFTSDADATVFGIPSEDPGTHWFQNSNTLEANPGILEFELTAVDSEVLGVLFGATVPHYESPEQSVLVTYTDKVPGSPAFPRLAQTRWWQRRQKRVNAEIWKAYTDELDAWHAAGRPDREIERRMFMPRATVEALGDGFRVTPRG